MTAVGLDQNDAAATARRRLSAALVVLAAMRFMPTLDLTVVIVALRTSSTTFTSRTRAWRGGRSSRRPKVPDPACRH